MKLAIMQPYFFPFLGYFNLVKHADVFIFLSDAQYIRRGYINKNKIQGKTGPINITIPVKKADRSASITDVFPAETLEQDYDLIARQCKHAYGKCLGYPSVAQILLDTLIAFQQTRIKHIGALASHSIIETSRFLGFDCEFLQSTDFPNSSQLRGQERILDICKQIGGVDSYINRPGGQSLYNMQNFSENNIKLEFLDDTRIKHHNSILHDIAYEFCLPGKL